MFKLIKLWWYCGILKRVLYDDDNKPYDYHGLQVVDGKFIISNEWKGYYYFRRGRYLSEYGCLQADMKNPYYLEDLQRTLARFKC